MFFFYYSISTSINYDYGFLGPWLIQDHYSRWWFVQDHYGRWWFVGDLPSSFCVLDSYVCSILNTTLESYVRRDWICSLLILVMMWLSVLDNQAVWKFDGIGFYPNGKLNKAIFTYKLFPGELMRKVKYGECSPLWLTLLFFTQYDGKFFMTPIIVHQAKETSQYLHFNIPLEWTVHHTPYSYMDIYGWIKSMTQLSNVCGTSPINNQIIFFDGHASHFNDRALKYMDQQNIQPFRNYGNGQNNDIRPNAKHKSHCSDATLAWLLKYGTTQILPHHMNSILMESWDAFKVSSSNIARDIYVKTDLPHLSITDSTIKTQACSSSIQLPSWPKAE